MADLFASPTYTPRSTGFARCPTCAGMGFHKRGVFGDRSFSKCPACHGLGMTYLDPAPDRTASS